MFDNLRESASSSSFYEEEANELYREPESKPLVAPAKRRGGPRFLGMTGPQRFLLSLMFLFTVCILGTLAMFLLGKMSLF